MNNIDHIKKQKGPNNTRFSIGDRIKFLAGYRRDTFVTFNIINILDDEIYLDWDCYWFPIKDDESRKISLI